MMYIPCWGGPCDGMLAPNDYNAFPAPGGWYYRTNGRGGQLFMFSAKDYIAQDAERWFAFQPLLRSTI